MQKLLAYICASPSMGHSSNIEFEVICHTV